MQDSTFGDKIKRIRLSKGDSVRKVALYAGISASYYSQVENNKRSVPKPNTLRKIAKGLHLSEDEIFKLANLIPADSKQVARQKLKPIGIQGPKIDLKKHSTFSKVNYGISAINSKSDKPINQQPNRISLSATSARLYIPANARVQTKLPPQNDETPATSWLKVTDSNLVMLGILKNDLAVIDSSGITSSISSQTTKLIAINLTTTKTTIRRALLVADEQVMLTTGSPAERPTFLPYPTFVEKFVGNVLNLYRDTR